MDVIALAKAGIDEAVAPNGTAVTEAQLERMWRLAEVPILCFDGDAAGQKAAVRAALRALPMVGPGRSLKIALLPDGLDPDEFIQQLGSDAFTKLIAKGLPLDEFIWLNELAAADTETPEGRATLSKRLRDHAHTIADVDTKTLYLGAFKQRHHDLFYSDSATKERFTKAGQWAKGHVRANPQLVAISKLGMATALFAPAALKGLRRFPAVISSHAEIVGLLPAILAHRDLRLICQEMLSAALTFHPLEREQLESILKDAGRAAELERAEKRERVPFSFLRAGISAEVAERDLASVLEHLQAEPAIIAAVEEATRRLEEEKDDAAFGEQVRLQAERQAFREELTELLRRQHEEVS